MVKTQQLSDKWIKASILGTIWASSEIVLGSFLHNLRVPFSGNVLTAIGIIILISASYKWKESGIFWRAGVICALLKTLSPSAVIFGPFVAILSEALLLELSVRVLGRTIPGLIIGSILAMSWNLFYKIFKLILFYGNNIIDVYTNLMQYAEQQMGLQFDAVWTPLILLLFIQILFGLVSALIGIRTGSETVNNKTPFQNKYKTEHTENSFKHSNFSHSINWLIINIVLMIGSLVLIGRINFAIWVVLEISIAIVWALRYKRALRQLVRPRIWIYFLLITMITAFVFTRMQSDSKTITDSLLIGVEMNLRAIILIMGFSVLGTELYNPKIRDYFARSYFKQLPLALQLSLESLPMMIANTPDLKTIVKNPTLFVHHIMSFADFRLNEIKIKKKFKQQIFIIAGEVGSGKTGCIKNLIENFQKKSISVSGVYSSRIMENNITTGYNVVNISTNKSAKFLRKEGDLSQQKIGRFYIFNEGLNAGNIELQNSYSQITIVDEIGKLELSKNGWYKSVKQLIKNSNSHLILTVRDKFVNQIIEKFGIKPVFVLNVPNENYEDSYERIITAINKNYNTE
jgi:nucleoside-triphosphatase THEP1